ncbi:MAG: transmembrane 220 family protein [Granulosicoccus sp.]
MRYASIVLMCLMLLFMGVQYNDPDGLMWMVIYAVPACWCAVAGFWWRAFDHAATQWALACSILAALGGIFLFWPLTPRFWTKDVWYNVETAREGMGLMIVTGVLLFVFFSLRRAQLKATATAGAPG